MIGTNLLSNCKHFILTVVLVFRQIVHVRQNHQLKKILTEKPQLNLKNCDLVIAKLCEESKQLIILIMISPQTNARISTFRRCPDRQPTNFISTRNPRLSEVVAINKASSGGAQKHILLLSLVFRGISLTRFLVGREDQCIYFCYFYSCVYAWASIVPLAYIFR